MRRWFGLVLIGIAFVSAALSVGKLPAAVTLDFSRLVPFTVTPTAASSSGLQLFALPLAAAGVWLLMQWAKTGSAARLSRVLWGNRVPAESLNEQSIQRFAPTYDVIANLVIALLVAFHFLLLAVVFNSGTAYVRVILISMGALLLLAGNLMPRLRPNPVMGLRTRATLNDPVLWTRMHRVFGGLLVASGVLVIVLALVAVRYALLGLLATLLLSCLIAFAVLVHPPHGTGRAGVVL